MMVDGPFPGKLEPRQALGWCQFLYSLIVRNPEHLDRMKEKMAMLDTGEVIEHIRDDYCHGVALVSVTRIVASTGLPSKATEEQTSFEFSESSTGQPRSFSKSQSGGISAPLEHAWYICRSTSGQIPFARELAGFVWSPPPSILAIQREIRGRAISDT